MKCSPELEELLQVVFNLKSREVDVLMVLCDGEKTVEQVAEELGLDRTTTQNYVSGLRKTGLLKRRKQGRKYLYFVNSRVLRQEASEKLESWTDEKHQAIEEI
ncbi:MAG: helix-turn-helix domain-containing protein [Candidatus Nanohaloarchaea archaeon]